MTTPALPFRLIVAGATGLLLLGGVVAAVTVDEEETASSMGVVDAPGPDDTSSSTSVAESPVDLPVIGSEAPGAAPGPTTDPLAAVPPGPSSTAATRAGRTTTTTAARPGAAAAPGPLVAPKVGSYGYDSTGSAGSSRVTVTVEAAGTEGADTLQDITIPSDQLGQRTSIRSRVAWGPAGAIIRRSQAAGGDCGWQPPWPQYQGGLTVGKAWSYDTRCTVTMPVQATIERRGNRRVTGAQTVEVAGRRAATWTLAVDETTVVTTVFGVITVRSIGTEQLAPSLGVPVAKTEALSGTGVAAGSTSTLTLVTVP